jgi:hypothetical protein
MTHQIEGEKKCEKFLTLPHICHYGKNNFLLPAEGFRVTIEVAASAPGAKRKGQTSG